MSYFFYHFLKHLLWATVEKGYCANIALTQNCLPSWTQHLATQLFNIYIYYLNVLPKRSATIETECACNIKGAHFCVQKNCLYKGKKSKGVHVVLLHTLAGKVNSTCNRSTKFPATIKYQISNRKCQHFKFSTEAHLPCVYLSFWLLLLLYVTCQIMQNASNQGFLSEILVDILPKFFLRSQPGFSLFISSLIPSLYFTLLDQELKCHQPL